jgi:hypothetical protein
MGSTESKSKLLAEKAIKIYNTTDTTEYFPTTSTSTDLPPFVPSANNTIPSANNNNYVINSPSLPTMAVHKKYRARAYEFTDTLYAKQLANIYYSSHNIETKEQFNIFTEYLMDESVISRNALLDAIDDYQYKRALPAKYSLSVLFMNAAFNYRPYQPAL